MQKKKLLSLTVFFVSIVTVFCSSLSAGATETEKNTSDSTQSAQSKETQTMSATHFNEDISKGNIIISTGSDAEDGAQVCPGNIGNKKCLGHTITGKTGQDGGKPNTIIVGSGNHDIILDGVEIYGGEYTNGSTTIGANHPNVCAFEIQGDATVNLTLKGTNILVSGDTCAGIRVMEQEGRTASLNIGGDGSLVAKSTSGGAGIGADQYGGAGNITINSGNITAIGAKRCAGIGGAAGKNGSGGTITITGGTVNATGGDSDDRGVENGIPAGAGIGCGGGCTQSKGKVIISGGLVTAAGGANASDSPADGINCSVLSSAEQSATIYTNGIYEGSGSDRTDMSKFNAMVWDLDKKICNVYNDAIMKDNLDDDQKIIIGKNCSLAILEPQKYSLAGTIEGDGTIINKDYLRDNGGNAEGVSNQKVSLTAADIKIPSNLVYTGDNLLGLFEKNKERKIFPDKNKPNYYDIVPIDHPELWTATATPKNSKDKNNYLIDAGDDYTVTFSRKGYPDIEIKNISVKPKEITRQMVILEDQEYTGDVIKPDVVITYDGTLTGKRLTTPADSNDPSKLYDYTVSYGDDPEKTNVDVKNKNDKDHPVLYIHARWGGNYIIPDIYEESNSLPVPFSIVAATIKDDTSVSFKGDGIEESSEQDTYEAIYKGTAYEPEITVTLPSANNENSDTSVTENLPLKEGTDYKVSVSPGDPDTKERTDAGVYTYTIEGIRNYGGKKEVLFEIKQKPLSIKDNSVTAETSKTYDTTSEIKLTNADLDGVAEGQTKKEIGIDLDKTIGIIRNPDGTKAKDVTENPYTSITIENLTLTGTEKDNYYIDPSLYEQYENDPTTLKDGNSITIIPADVEPPELSGIPGDKENKFTYDLSIKERTDDPIYDDLKYQYRYRMENDTADSSAGEDNWTYGISDGVTNLFEGLEAGKYIFEARSLATNNVNESEFGGTDPKIVTIGRLPAENTPEGFRLQISDTVNPDGETFIATVEPPTSFDPAAKAIQYCIVKADDDAPELNYKDFLPIEGSYNPNRETECESATTYIAYVRYKETETRKASESEESELLVGETGTLTVETPVISFYKDDNEEDDDSTIVGEHEYRGSAKVQITCETSGARIYYTMDGTEPTEKSIPYEGEPISLERKYENKETRETTIRAIAVKPKWNSSSPEAPGSTVTFTRQLPDVEKPVLTISSDTKETYTFTNSTTVTIECATEGAKIYYTTAENGEAEEPDPANESQLYKGSFKIRETTSFKAIACKKDMETSAMDPVTITKLESSMDGPVWLPEPFARTGAETENNTIAPLLLKKIAEDLNDNTASKEEISDEIGRQLFKDLQILGGNKVFVNDKIAYYDLVGKIKIDNDDWKDIDDDDFPEEGFVVEIDYPEGTSMKANDFAIAHMFASGEEIGKVEHRAKEDITKTPDKLQFTLTSASPIAIAWTESGGDWKNLIKEPDGTDGEDPNPPDTPDPENPGEDDGKKDDKSNDTGVKSASDSGNDAGSGNTISGLNGIGEITEAIKSAASSLLPKTGDTNKIIAWVIAAVVAVGVIIAIRIRSKKSTKPKKKH